MRGISIGFRHPKRLLGGTSILMLAAVIPMVIQLVMEHFLLRADTPSKPVFVAIFIGAPMVVSLLLLPLNAGYLQTVDAAERGLKGRARDIFKPYQEGTAPSIIGYGLVLLLVYVALAALVIAVTGGGLPSWYMQLLTAQANHLPPPGIMPAGMGIAIALMVVLGVFMVGFYSISLGQVALRRREVFSAIADGFIGTMKNLLPLLVFILSLILGWLVILIGVVLIALVLMLVGKLVGVWAVFALVIPLYIALFLVMISGMFGLMYHLWRDVCGSDIVPATDPSIFA